MTLFTTFQQELEQTSGTKLKVKINNNHSTMLSVKWESDCTKVSLHRMFLDAPSNVMEALACYIRKEEALATPTIKAFINDGLKKIDNSNIISGDKLSTKGNVYDLQKIYNGLNKFYFNNQLNLSLTWFGKKGQNNRSCIAFGLYYDPLKLIKINRLLDQSFIPDYLISFVIYHEMLHCAYPSFINEKGRHCRHTKDFKEKEKEFTHYARAQSWLKEHQENLFFDPN